MKKAFAIIIAIFLPLFAWGQAQINTKKVKLSDFTQKVTKIVLSGNEFMDSAFKDEVTARWRISPYEFCTLNEFNALKTSGDYYFLLITSGQFRKDSSPTFQFLTLVKGGIDPSEGLDDMLEVVSMPIASAQFPSGREIAFLPAFLDIIQGYTLDSMEKDSNAYGGLGNYSGNLTHSEGFQIVLSSDDIAEGAIIPDRQSKKVSVMEEEDADELMLSNAPNTIVSYVVAPFEPQPGAFCYKMLIDTQTHTLYYYKRHKISAKAGVGFLSEDLKRIYSTR